MRLRIRDLKCYRGQFRASARMRKHRRFVEVNGIPNDIKDIWWAIKMLDKWDYDFNRRYKYANNG